jgi:uncharacterized RDD family membrane protein YckC
VPATHRLDQEFAQVGDLGEQPLATYGGRLLARLADLLIVFVPTYFPFKLFIEGNLAHLLAVLVTLTAYDAILTAKTGVSPGKRLARIKVVQTGTGAPPGWRRALVRALVLGVFTWLVNAVVAVADEHRHRGAHDRLAGTIVIAA